MFKYYLSFSEYVVLLWNLTKILIWELERQVGFAKEKNSECGLKRGVRKRGGVLSKVVLTSNPNRRSCSKPLMALPIPVSFHNRSKMIGGPIFTASAETSLFPVRIIMVRSENRDREQINVSYPAFGLHPIQTADGSDNALFYFPFLFTVFDDLKILVFSGFFDACKQGSLPLCWTLPL